MPSSPQQTSNGSPCANRRTRIALKPLAEQVMVITGASSGIGLVTAKRAAARGAKVMLVARNREALAHAVDVIAVGGGHAAFAVADVAHPAELEKAADAAIERFGRIDTWVNDAGVAIYAKLEDTPLDEHERLFATNYFGVVNGCRAAIPHLKGGGALITVGSIASDLPTPVLGAYAASKHAVKAYVEALRMELHADRLPIAVTLIKPAGIDTPIGQHAANHGAGEIQGEALVPPPLYAPELVADAICHAAEHVRRDITVGGIGRMNVLIGQHFPWVLDLVTPRLTRAIFDPAKPPTSGDTLFSSAEAGRERSGGKSPRQVSAYTTAQLHPLAAVGVGVALLGVAAALTRRAGGAPSSSDQAKDHSMTDTRERPFAVVTGGDNGIGLELAGQFADNGYDVLIAGEEPSHLADAAQTLSTGGARIDTHAGDLSQQDEVAALYEAIGRAGRPVDILCVNAGIGLGGAFSETDLETELKMIDLNIRGAVQLSKLVLKDMVTRDAGQILLTSSIAATMPDPFEAVYGGTKVFLRWFGEALRNELKDTGVGVTVLMPGVTETNFFNRADMMDTKAGASENKDNPADVAKAAFAALKADKDKVLPKLKNKVMGTIADALPDAVAASAHRGMSEPGSAE